MAELLAVLIVILGGIAGGLVGVGGGVLFVPALALCLGLSQVEAESTSLLMIVFVAFVGTIRQRSYGNVNMRDALVIGILSPLGVLIGVVISNALPQRALELTFAAFVLFVAYKLVRNALGEPAEQA